MPKLKLSKTTRAIALALAVAPLAGIAQAGGPGGGCEDTQARHARHHGKHGDHAMHRMNRHVDGRMAFLKAEIDVTEAQEGQWQAVEEVLRAGIEKRAEHMAQRRNGRADDGGPSAPERLAGHIEAMESLLDHMKEMESALSDLYAVLTPEQRASADELLPRAGMGHRFKARHGIY